MSSFSIYSRNYPCCFPEMTSGCRESSVSFLNAKHAFLSECIQYLSANTSRFVSSTQLHNYTINRVLLTMCNGKVGILQWGKGEFCSFIFLTTVPVTLYKLNSSLLSKDAVLFNHISSLSVHKMRPQSVRYTTFSCPQTSYLVLGVQTLITLSFSQTHAEYCYALLKILI